MFTAFYPHSHVHLIPVSFSLISFHASFQHMTNACLDSISSFPFLPLLPSVSSVQISPLVPLLFLSLILVIREGNMGYTFDTLFVLLTLRALHGWTRILAFLALLFPLTVTLTVWMYTHSLYLPTHPPTYLSYYLLVCLYRYIGTIGTIAKGFAFQAPQNIILFLCHVRCSIVCLLGLVWRAEDRCPDRRDRRTTWHKYRVFNFPPLVST